METMEFGVYDVSHLASDLGAIPQSAVIAEGGSGDGGGSRRTVSAAPRLATITGTVAKKTQGKLMMPDDEVDKQVSTIKHNFIFSSRQFS